MKISLIAAVGSNNVIGTEGDLPWNLPDDMKFFSRTTKGHHVLMGRKNYESIPQKYRPLPGRPNLVVTRQEDYKAEGAHVFQSIKAAVAFAEAAGEEELFIIGGGEIYQQTIEQADKLYITHVDASPSGDAKFPAFDPKAFDKEVIEEHSKDDVHNHSFTICTYVTKH